jgi:PKD repeat protein
MRRTSAIKFIFAAFIGLGLVLNWQDALTNSSGAPAGYTNAPGEANCTSCHTGTLNAPSASVSMTINGSNSFYYKPDTTYNIAISATKSGISKWGFEATALKDSDNSFSGTMVASNFAVAVINTTISGKTRYYATQTSSGTSGSNGRSWSFQWTAPHTNVGNISFYITACAANGNNLSSGDIIYANKITLAPAPKVPIPGFSYSPKSPCEGDTVYFTDTSKQATNWNWSFTGGTPSSSTLQNPKVVFKVWGGHFAKMTASNSQGAAPTVTKIVNVNPKPSDTVYRLKPIEFCFGDSTKLKAYTGDKYLWSTGDTNQIATFKSSGNYYVTVTSNGCSTKSKTVSVYEHSKPALTFTRTLGGDTLCLGDTAKFKLTTTATTYKYYNGSTQLVNSGYNLTLGNLSGTKNRIYSLVWDALGCRSDTSTIYKEIVRTRLPAPVLTAGTSTTYSVTATWKLISGATGYDVSLDSGKTWTWNGGNLSFTRSGMNPNSSITINVRARDVAPCNIGFASSIILTTLPCSKKTYSLYYDTLICPKNYANVNFFKISASRYGLILNGTASRDTDYSFYLSKDSTVHFAIYDSMQPNCGTIGIDVPLRVISYPALQITADQPIYCGNGNAALVKANGNFEEYDVYLNGKLVQADILNTYTSSTFKDGDQVQMIAYYRGCTSDSSNKITLHRYPAPSAFFNYKNNGKGDFSFINKSTGDDSRTWYFGDGNSDTSANPSHTYSTNKIYTVWLVISNKFGCRDSISKTITATGIKTGIVDGESLKIMPNPFSNEFQFSFDSKSSGILQISITDIQGKNVQNINPVRITKGNNTITIPAGNLKPGTYILIINDGRASFNTRVVRQRD